MSHTVLKSTRQNSSKNSTFDTVMGTLEVYWEQLRNSSLMKAKGKNTPRDDDNDLAKHFCSEQEQGICNEWQKIGSKHIQRSSDGGSLKLVSNFVFG